METIKGKILSKRFDVTRTGNGMLIVQIEGGNPDGYMLFNNLHHAQFLKVGHDIEVDPARKAVIIPNNFNKFYQSTNGKMAILSYNNLIEQIKNEKFGERIDIADFEAQQKIDEYILEELKIKDMILETYKKSDAKYAKALLKDSELPKTKQTYDLQKELQITSNRIMDKALKSYRIVESESGE